MISGVKTSAPVTASEVIISNVYRSRGNISRQAGVPDKRRGAGNSPAK